MAVVDVEKQRDVNLTIIRKLDAMENSAMPVTTVDRHQVWLLLPQRLAEDDAAG